MTEFGAIHIACNNAGVFAGGLLWEESLADFKWQLMSMYGASWHGIRTFVPIMAAQDSECHIVNTSSMAALTAMPYSGIYHMTKHAVLGMSESLYHELAFHVPNVKVSVLCPEAINTGIAASERNRPGAYSAEGDIVESDARALVSQALTDSVAAGIGPMSWRSACSMQSLKSAFIFCQKTPGVTLPIRALMIFVRDAIPHSRHR